MIRGIRVISGQLNIIHTRIYFFRTLIERIKVNLAKCVALAFLRTIYMYARQQHIIRQSESQQPQAVTLANPFRIPMHRKNKGQKKIRGQRLRVHPFNPWAFFWPSPCGRRLTGRTMARLTTIHLPFIIYRTLTAEGTKNQTVLCRVHDLHYLCIS